MSVSKFSNKLLLCVSVLVANVDGNGNLFLFPSFIEMEQKQVSVSSCHLFLINLLSIYGACSYLGSNRTIHYSVGASFMPADVDLTYCATLT